jgi:hypothetical protein
VAGRAERCSDRSRRLAETVAGTASAARNWLLIEHPGPWGRDALASPRLSERLTTRIAPLARRVGVRVLLVRRHGRTDRDGMHVLACHSGPDGVWMERGHVDQPEDVLALDLEALGRSRTLGLGRDRAEPLFLVCTHGRRDICCAEKGRPVAAALSEAYPEQTWETSHVGGDRFAANLVCLPHGLFYGRVTPVDAPRIAGQYQDGEIELDAYRGRSCYDFSTQAAEAHLRRLRGVTAVDALRLVRRAVVDGDVEATFAASTASRYTVRIRPRLDGARPLTCSSHRAERPTSFDIVAVDTT